MGISAGISQHIGLIKGHLLHSEHHRLGHNLASFQKEYTSLLVENKIILKELEHRASNQSALQEALKQVNRMILKAGNLRVGPSQQKVV